MIGRTFAVKTQTLLQCRNLLNLNKSACVFSTYDLNLNQQKQTLNVIDPVKDFSSDKDKYFSVDNKKSNSVGLHEVNNRDYMHYHIPNKWKEEYNFPQIKNFQDLVDVTETVCLQHNYLLPYYLINNAYHLLLKTEPSKIASVILKMRNMNRDSDIYTENFDRYFIISFVKILSKQHFVKERFVTEKLKPLMICLKQSGLKTYEDQRNFIYKELPEKYHFFSDIFLLQEERLKSWTLLNRFEFLQNLHNCVIEKDVAKSENLLKSVMKANNAEFLNKKVLYCVAHDTGYSNHDLNHTDGYYESLYDILLSKCSILPVHIANKIILFYISLGEVEKVKQVHSKDQTTNRLKRSFPVYFLPKEYLLKGLKCQQSDAAIRTHLESMYGRIKVDWIYVASYLLEDMLHKCPKTLIENLNWSSLRFFRSLFYSPSLSEVLPKHMEQLLKICIKFEHFNVDEFLNHCFAYALNRNDFEQVQNMVLSLKNNKIKISDKLKYSITSQYIKNGLNLPDGLELSKIHQKLRYPADLKYVLQQVIMHPPSDKLTFTLIEDYLCKIKSQQIEKVENILIKANGKFGIQLYEFSKLFSTRIKTLLNEKCVNEALVLVNKNSKQLSPYNKETFWTQICKMFSEYTIENKEIDVILKFNNCKLPVKAKNLAKVNLVYCKLKLEDELLNSLVSQLKFHQLISLTKILVGENDFYNIEKIYKSSWNDYRNGNDNFLRDFTSSLLVAGFSNDSLAHNLNKLEKSVCHDSYLTVFTKAISQINSPDNLVHLKGYMERHANPCAMDKVMFIEYIVDACIKMSTNLTRKDKLSLEKTLEEFLRLYSIPGFYLQNTTKLLSLQHHLKFDSMCNFINCPTISTDPNFDVLEHYNL